CDVVAGTSGDCNGNGTSDDCEDCNGNTRADACDIAEGVSRDCNDDGIARQRGSHDAARADDTVLKLLQGLTKSV
ncbi:MAG: hypothetical protein ACREEE_04025, partial [Dongiaceae bacterium]